jgi:hypothetical protein
MRQSVFRIVAGAVALVVALILATWALGGFTGLSTAGDVALILGITLTIGLGIGLMALVFYSSRSERDEAVYRPVDAFDRAGSKPSRPAPPRGPGDLDLPSGRP